MFSHLGSISFRETFGLILRFINWDVFGDEEHMLVRETGWVHDSGWGWRLGVCVPCPKAVNLKPKPRARQTRKTGCPAGPRGSQFSIFGFKFLI